MTTVEQTATVKRMRVPMYAIIFVAFFLLVAFNMPAGSGSAMIWLGASGLPMVIADLRGHHNRIAIVVLNSLLFAFALFVTHALSNGGFIDVLIFGFLFLVAAIGWLVALIWAFTSVKEVQRKGG
jgi:hypothetical protein